MKLKRLFIAGALIFFSSACWTAEERILHTPQFLPVIALDFADLDARDAQNRPLFGAVAVGELVVLFRQNAAQLLLQADSHAQQLIQGLLSAFSPLFNGLFLKSLVDRIRRFSPAIVNAIRRVVHNVHNLWVSSSVGSWRTPAAAPAFSLSRKPQKLFLRC